MADRRPVSESPPAALAKRGLARVTDNRAGRAVAIRPGAIVTLFKAELQARYLRVPTPAKKPKK